MPLLPANRLSLFTPSFASLVRHGSVTLVLSSLPTLMLLVLISSATYIYGHAQSVATVHSTLSTQGYRDSADVHIQIAMETFHRLRHERADGTIKTDIRDAHAQKESHPSRTDRRDAQGRRQVPLPLLPAAVAPLRAAIHAVLLCTTSLLSEAAGRRQVPLPLLLFRT